MSTERPRLTRRRTVLGTAALLSAGGLTAVLSRPSRATVTQTDLQVADGEHASPTGDIHSPWLTVVGDWSFTLAEPAAGWRVRLTVSSDGTDWAPIAAHAESVEAADASGSYELTAPVIDHPAFDADTFDAPLGETVETRVFVMTQFAALDENDGTMADAEAGDDTTIRVVNTTEEATASLAGDGDVAFQVDSSDEPPG